MKELEQNQTEFILYTAPQGKVSVEVMLLNETVWLSINQMALLFGVDKSGISRHLKNIFNTGELDKTATVAKFATVQNEGGREINRNIDFYNLDAIISVGYRVNSIQGTKFRIWATQTLKEYIIKGFAMDDDRLKQGKTVFGKDYFKELLERVRSIRASERRIYLQITDIFQECSIDYDKNATTTKSFFATVQNKFHFAITGNTAAEIIYLKADSNKENMGLATWKNAPTGRIIKSDTQIAKNYLSEKDIKRLERTVTAYFDYIENIIESRTTFTMEALAESVNKFLTFNEFKTLDGFGTVSHQQAIEKASTEYNTFNKTQKITSDFDKQIKKLKK